MYRVVSWPTLAREFSVEVAKASYAAQTATSWKANGSAVQISSPGWSGYITSVTEEAFNSFSYVCPYGSAVPDDAKEILSLLVDC